MWPWPFDFDLFVTHDVMDIVQAYFTELEGLHGHSFFGYSAFYTHAFSQTWPRYVWLMAWQIRLSVCLSSVTCVHPTQGLNFSGIFLHRIVTWPSGNSPTKNHEDRPKGSPSPRGLNRKVLSSHVWLSHLLLMSFLLLFLMIWFSISLQHSTSVFKGTGAAVSWGPVPTWPHSWLWACLGVDFSDIFVIYHNLRLCVFPQLRPGPHCGSLQRFHRSHSWWGRASCPLPRTPFSAIGPATLGFRPCGPKRPPTA